MVAISKRLNRGNEQGVMLIEIMIAVFVLSIGILAVASMQGSAIRGNDMAKQRSESIHLAEDKIEKLLSLAYTDADLEDKTGDDAAGLGDDTAATADYNEIDPDYPNFNIYWNVWEDEPGPNFKTLSVIVKWSSRGSPRSTTIDFIKGNL